jgi:hypothetical protein
METEETSTVMDQERPWVSDPQQGDDYPTDLEDPSWHEPRDFHDRQWFGGRKTNLCR